MCSSTHIHTHTHTHTHSSTHTVSHILQANYSVLLIGALNNISVGTQPDVFFSFSGGHGAVSHYDITIVKYTEIY